MVTPEEAGRLVAEVTQAEWALAKATSILKKAEVAAKRAAADVPTPPPKGAMAIEIPMETDVALVIGHEDRGCTPATLAACDGVAFIPQLGKVGSLNVAHAASIAIYETRRRSWSR